jgi:hypothetical protein
MAEPEPAPAPAPSWASPAAPNPAPSWGTGGPSSSGGDDHH